MARETKPPVSTEVFEKLDIRVGRVYEVSEDPTERWPLYSMKIDFGKFGKKTSAGRFTNTEAADLEGSLVLAVLNFEKNRKVGCTDSEVLVLGVQYPKAQSGEATPLTPLHPGAKIGGKVF